MNHESRHRRMAAWRLKSATLLSIAAAVVCFHTSTSADDADRQAGQELVEKWFVTYHDIQSTFAVTLSDSETPTDNLPSKTTLAVHHGAARGGGVLHGRAYVWTKAGRPAVVGSVWSRPDRMRPDVRNVCYQFHSVSQQPVKVEQNGARVWSCEQPGVEWLQHRGPEVPAASRRDRLTQMQQIARDYQCGNLRLLPRPIYRFPEDTTGALDGALFAFVSFSYPQVYLLVEARDEKWSVAFARSEILPKEVTYDGKVVWSVEKTLGNFAQFIRSDSEPFFIHYTRERRPADNPEQILAGNE